MFNINNQQQINFPFDNFTYKVSSMFSSKIIKEYIFNWKQYFELFSSVFDIEYSEFIQRFEQYEKVKKRYEYYQFSQHFDEVKDTYLYNFDIERIKIRTNHTKFKRLFTKKIECISNFCFYPNVLKSEINIKPIILYPFCLDNKSFLIIDGNHRFSYQLNNNKLLTKAIFMDSANLSDFIFSIDWAMFMFVWEANKLLNNLITEDIETYVNKSGFLKTNYFKAVVDYVGMKNK